MLSPVLVALALAITGSTNAQLPANVPTCITRCAATKVQEGYCSNQNIFNIALQNCLNDHCSPADAQTGGQYASQICAAASSLLASAGGSATATQTGAISSILSSAASASAPSASAMGGASASSASASSASASGGSASASATSPGAAPAPSATGNATEYATGAVAALNAAGLTSLASAIEAASPTDLLMALMQGQHTVFAPTNEALAALGSGATGNATALTALLSYHVLEGYADPSSLQEGNHTVVRSSLRGAPFVNLPGNQTQAVVLTSIGGNKTVVEPTRNITSIGNATYQNLNIQVVPQALSIPGSLVQTLSNVSDLSMLVQAANGVSPNLIAELSAIPGLTIFAPVNSAFSAAASALSGANQTTIQNVLLNHIVNGTAVYSSLISPSTNATSAGGQPLSFISNSTGTFVTSGSATARVMQSDVIIQNGVVHTIDGVLLNTASDPNAAAAAASSASSAGAQQTGSQTGAVTPQATAQSGGQGGGGSGGGSGTTSGSAPSASASNSGANGLLVPAAGVTTGVLGWLALELFA